MMPPDTRHFSPPTWPARSAALIQGRIDSLLRMQGRCSVMLTGGRSAARLYADWSAHPAFARMRGVSFYFGDERCVPADDPESNYGMAMRTLFQRGVPAGCPVFRMEADDPDSDAAARRYDHVLPEAIDVLLLGVGEDGHVASLFPGSRALHETVRRVVPVSGPKAPRDRLTVTPGVIARAGAVFMLAAGPSKAGVLGDALKSPGEIEALPARLALNATWLLDDAPPESVVQ